MTSQYQIESPCRKSQQIAGLWKESKLWRCTQETGMPVQYRMVKLFARMQPPLNSWKLMTCVNYPCRTESKCMWIPHCQFISILLWLVSSVTPRGGHCNQSFHLSTIWFALQCGYIWQFRPTIIRSDGGAERAQEVTTADHLLTWRTAPSWRSMDLHSHWWMGWMLLSSSTMPLQTTQHCISMLKSHSQALFWRRLCSFWMIPEQCIRWYCLKPLWADTGPVQN